MSMNSNTTSHDPVHSPAHYPVYPVQPIEITRHMDFCLGNAVKYVLRAPFKGGVEDIQKARQYLVWVEENQQMHSCEKTRLRVEAAEKLGINLLNTADAQAQGLFLMASEVFAACLSRPACSDTRRIAARALRDMRTHLDSLQSLLEARS